MDNLIIILILGFGTFVIGGGILIWSNVEFYRESKENPFKYFWLPKKKMSEKNWILNRFGFFLTILGLGFFSFLVWYLEWLLNFGN